MESTPMSKLEKAQKEVKKFWNLCCEDDGIPVDSNFVVFTSVNRYANDYNKAVRKFFAAVR
jgi:hypothetical protein